MTEPLWIEVIVETWDGELVREYIMDHNDIAQRRVLGEQCRNAFEAGQWIITGPQRNPSAK